MRVGILGGTFNPVHIGHLVLAEQIRESLQLNSTVFIPAFIPPHKNNIGGVSPEDRCRMVEIAIQGNAAFCLSDVEIKKQGISYSVETLRLLHKQLGKGTNFFFITGSDSLEELSSWKNIQEVFNLSQFVIAGRPGFPLKKVPRQVKIVPITSLEISSTEIRKRIREGHSIRYLVPEGVREYIISKGLYKT
jgi:nicotinate-nucleotide adenylyltransferase